MYDRILVPTDGSEYAEDAAERAFDLAETTDAAVHVVCVVEQGPLGSVRLPGDDASAADAFAERAEEFVGRLAERARERSLEVETEIREGVPVRELLDYADEVDAEVAVMGSRGRGEVSRMMLGSVTDGVAREGDIDVLVVGENGDAD
ncbi:UspA domain-containing protein [Natronococcus amylolyticus DSM 10524]|uniref:UspA domain-containing protein n=1 Tax=Natronococcus amylolyticus DSM 10524 TaxID=1227497 RepID=L9WZ45_9EURY|nr:universal stress protein [Natronococcus amylolyticus]ELY54441.1 UspA domain-containing protein [Natronococcus amylolyticus DSM 10524]